MPPFLPRKRLRSPSPGPSESKGKGKAIAKVAPRKQTLFDALDGSGSPGHTVQKTKNLLARLAGSDDEDSELTSLSSSEPDFEDVPPTKKQRTQKAADSESDEDEDIEFEDIATQRVSTAPAPPPSGDLDLTLTKETRISLTNPHNKKQGPSKIERQIRVSTHCMHVQFLLWHNWLRNRWISDEDVQQILLKQLGPNIQKEIQKWRTDSGLSPVEEVKEKNTGGKKAKKGKRGDDRAQRDWGEPAERLELGNVNMSRGDPLFRLIRALSAYWKKIFRIIAPGLRKMGYMSLSVLDEEIKGFNKDPQNTDRHGERIQDVKEFRDCAKICEGSRDVSAQLFTALLRGIGLEARMVASLQPVGFGWSKNEEAVETSKKRFEAGDAEESSASEEVDHDKGGGQKSSKGKKQIKPNQKETSISNPKKASKSRSRGSGLRGAPINVSDSEPLDLDNESEDESVVDVTPSKPRRAPSKSYEKDLPPNYWTEVLSPVTNTYHAVNLLNVNNPIATNPELLATFEPRGAKSEKAKQVIAYIVGFSPDGTAKDVTVRYLKRHMWPGKTKGFRMPVEKLPVYNHRGKIKRYEEFDWFKTAMSRYIRGGKSRTDVDDHEEATDLTAIKPEKKEIKEGEETLQSYKSSAEFVLERHLRREEALLPAAKHVKMFTVKGKKGEPASEEKVFLRKDVVSCKSVETWHKEGREPILGEQPLKRVPYRAATTNRKRELAEAEAATGEKMLQGLYSWDQTDWIIPPPIVNGIIPKNGYGNMDVYVPSMIPVGAVHIPRRRTKEICRRLGIDYAEAVTGFEFGARMAIPIITGVVIAEENKEMVLEQWEKDETERERKEDEKRTKAALGMWRRLLMGQRILKRVREEYGEDVDDNMDVLNPWINKKSKGNIAEKIEEETQRQRMDNIDEEMAGGFFPEGHDEEEVPQSFFPTRHDDDDDDEGGFFVEGHEQDEQQHNGTTAFPAPIHMLSDKRVQLYRVSEAEDDEDQTLDEDTRSRTQATVGPSRKPTAQKQSQSKSSSTSRKGKAPSTRATPRKSRPYNSKRRSRQADSSNEDGEEEEERTEEDSEPEFSPSKEPSPAPRAKAKRRSAGALAKRESQPQRTTPKRRAARKSETALKSHYFADSGLDEEDE